MMTRKSKRAEEQEPVYPRKRRRPTRASTRPNETPKTSSKQQPTPEVDSGLSEPEDIGHDEESHSDEQAETWHEDQTQWLPSSTSSMLSQDQIHNIVVTLKAQLWADYESRISDLETINTQRKLDTDKELKKRENEVTNLRRELNAEQREKALLEARFKHLEEKASGLETCQQGAHSEFMAFRDKVNEKILEYTRKVDGAIKRDHDRFQQQENAIKILQTKSSIQEFKPPPIGSITQSTTPSTGFAAPDTRCSVEPVADAQVISTTNQNIKPEKLQNADASTQMLTIRDYVRQSESRLDLHIAECKHLLEVAQSINSTMNGKLSDFGSRLLKIELLKSTAKEGMQQDHGSCQDAANQTETHISDLKRRLNELEVQSKVVGKKLHRELSRNDIQDARMRDISGKNESHHASINQKITDIVAEQSRHHTDMVQIHSFLSQHTKQFTLIKQELSLHQQNTSETEARTPHRDHRSADIHSGNSAVSAMKQELHMQRTGLAELQMRMDKQDLITSKDTSAPDDKTSDTRALNGTAAGKTINASSIQQCYEQTDLSKIEEEIANLAKKFQQLILENHGVHNSLREQASRFCERHELAELRSDMSACVERATKLEKDMLSIRESLDSDVDKFCERAELVEVHAMIKNQNERLIELRSACENIQPLLRDSDDQRARLRSILANIKATRDKQNDAAIIVQGQVADLRQQLEASQKQVEDLRTSLDVVIKDMSITSPNAGNSTMDMANILKEVEAFRDRIANVEDKSRRLIHENARTTLADLNRNKKSVARRFEDLWSSVNHMSKAITYRDRQISTLKQLSDLDYDLRTTRPSPSDLKQITRKIHHLREDEWEFTELAKTKHAENRLGNASSQEAADAVSVQPVRSSRVSIGQTSSAPIEL